MDGDILTTLVEESKIDVKSEEIPSNNAESVINLNNLNNDGDSESKSNLDIDVVSEGSCDTDCVCEHEHEPERNINYLKNNLSSSTSSTTSSLNKNGEGEEVVGDVLSFSKEELEKIQQCIMKGVGEDYAKEKYAYYRSLGFKFGSKEIGDVIALIVSNWKKDQKQKEKYLRQKQKDSQKKKEARYIEEKKKIPKEVLEKWDKLIAGLPSDTGNYASEAFKIHSIDEKTITIISPSIATCQAFNDKLKGHLMWDKLRLLSPGQELKIVYNT